MNKRKVKETFSQSIFALMISQVVVKILGLVYKLYLTNREGFGDEGNAISGSSFQIYALILSLTAIGIPGAISKLVAQRSSVGDHKGAYKIFKIALAIFSIVGIMGSYLLFYFAKKISNEYLHMPETELSIIALCPSVFLVSIISVLKGYFTGRENLKSTAKAQSLDQTSKTIFTVIMIELSAFIIQKTNTVIMAACSNLATTIGNIFEFLYLYKTYLKELPEIKAEIKNSVNVENIRIINVAREIIKVAIPISLTAIISTISKNIDSTTIVKELKGLIGYEEAKSQYGILSGKVDSLINFPLSFNMTIATALLPSIAAAQSDIKKQEKRINQSFLLGMTIAIPMVFVFLAYSNQILNLLFPNASNGAEILRMSSISIIAITIEQITNIILHAIGKADIPIKAITLGVIAKIILNKILVPRIDLPIGGTAGAAFATVVCHLIASGYSMYKLRKATNINISINNIVKPAIASTIFIIVSKLIYASLLYKINYKINLIFSIMIGSIIYLTMLKSLKIFNINDIRLLLKKEKRP